MKRINLKKGFTLIELLVVVAIIGILSSVVLGSLKTARDKAADAAIKADLSGIRATAEVNYDTNGGKYGTALYTADADCGATWVANTLFSAAGTAITTATAHIKTQNGNVALACNEDAAGTGYAIAVKLKSSAWWCIDSTGVSRGTTSGGATYTGLVGASPAAMVTGALVCN